MVYGFIDCKYFRPTLTYWCCNHKGKQNRKDQVFKYKESYFLNVYMGLTNKNSRIPVKASEG